MTESDRERYRELLLRHGADACSFQGLEGAFRFAFAADAGIAFATLPLSWMAVGSPLAPHAQLDVAARELAAQARAESKRALLFFGVEAPWASSTFRFLPLGEQPDLHPAHLRDTFTQSRSLRYQLRRAHNKGVRVRDFQLGDRDALVALHQRWLSTRRFPPLGFLLAFDPNVAVAERIVLLAEREGRVVGALCALPVPRREGYFVEHLFLDPDAPNGTSEQLLIEASLRFTERGASWFTLGLVPFSGSVPRWLRVAGTLLRPVYRADTLRAFRERLRPDSWSPVYVGYQEERHIAFVCRALYRAVRPKSRRALALGVLRTVAGRHSG